MPIVRTAVLLFAYPVGQNLNLHGDVFWYRNYFFGPSYGQAGYWIKQSDAQVVIDGDVFDWALVSDPAPNLMNRTDLINKAIAAMENDRDLNFDRFDIVVLVLGIPPNVNSDGGATTARSRNRQHAGIVTQVGASFDFVAHELGHAIGLNHSYGKSSYQNASWSQPGEYGHPYCIMSAAGYGGIGGSYHPAAPRDGRPEYSGLGPSINAATALARGWIRAHVHSPGDHVDLDLRSRHWLDAYPGFTPQALEIKVADQKNYIIEYRESAGWDMGQGSPVVIINAGKGSTADLAHPNTDSATCLGLIRLPISFGSPGSIFNGPGFGIEILDRSISNHTIRLRLRPAGVQLTPVEMTKAKQPLETTIVETGSTTFEPGEKLCIQGTWPYEKLERKEVAMFEATYRLAVPPVTATWVVDGQPLRAEGGTLNLLDKKVHIANAKLADKTEKKQVELQYQIEPLVNGSRLRLYNRASDETYDLTVAATLATAIGSGSAEEWVEFMGREYRYPQQFYDERDACIRRMMEIGQRYVRYKVLLEPDLWRRVREPEVLRVQQMIELLGQLHEQGEENAYRQVVGELARAVGTTSIAPIIVSRDERMDMRPQLIEQEPHLAVERQTPTAAVRRIPGKL